MLKLSEILVLRELEIGPSYSYKLGRDLGIHQSTMSYMLQRLETNGICRGKVETGHRGPARIYYRITDKGRNALRKDALMTLRETQSEADRIIAAYSQHQRTIQLLREIGGL